MIVGSIGNDGGDGMGGIRGGGIGSRSIGIDMVGSGGVGVSMGKAVGDGVGKWSNTVRDGSMDEVGGVTLEVLTQTRGREAEDNLKILQF